MLRISQLYIYPIKSLGGILLNEARVTDRGFEYDRRWMLVDHNNRFLSQREFAAMALLRPQITADGIKVSSLQTDDEFIIPFYTKSNELAEVTIWDDTCTGQYVSAEADAWFSKMLHIPCRLVYMPDHTNRVVDPKYTFEEKITSFADAYPFLMIAQESLDDLSNRVGEAVPINRFRPNMVFSGGEAYAEDELAHFSVNNIHFYGVKLCARCPIPGIDQDTAIYGKEPLRTLARYRRRNNKLYFGQNLVHDGRGIISVGNELEILKLKAAAVFD